MSETMNIRKRLAELQNNCGHQSFTTVYGLSVCGECMLPKEAVLERTVESQQATISKLRENNAELVDAVEQLFDQTSGESYAWVEPLLAKHNTTDGGEG